MVSQNLYFLNKGCYVLSLNRGLTFYAGAGPETFLFSFNVNVFWKSYEKLGDSQRLPCYSVAVIKASTSIRLFLDDFWCSQWCYWVNSFSEPILCPVTKQNCFHGNKRGSLIDTSTDLKNNLLTCGFIIVKFCKLLFIIGYMDEKFQLLSTEPNESMERNLSAGK